MTFELRVWQSVARGGSCGAGIEGAVDAACVAGEEASVVTMEHNDSAVEQIVGACCRGGGGRPSEHVHH